MKHITSKLLSLLLCLAMLMSMVPAAYADVETEGASGKNTPTETNGGASEQATPPSPMPSRQRRTATP